MELHTLTAPDASASTPNLHRLRLGLHASAEQIDKVQDGISEVPVEVSGQNVAIQTLGMENAELSRNNKTREYIQLAALYWCLFVAGWNDGSTGPLLPRMQEVYNVGYIIVSLIFVFGCVGCISGACLNVSLSQKLGFGKVLVLGSILQQIAFTLQAPQLPFPVFVMSFAINGMGGSLQDAQANGYVASLKTHSETKMGLLHAVYGAGALCAPLVATQFAQMKHWSYHYLVSLAIATINTIVLLAVFRFKNQDDCLAQIGVEPGEKGTSEKSHFRQILSLKTVHLLAVFILVYVGVEVTVGGWVVTYILTVRGGGANSGYISAGFFGGLMLGRVVLLWVNQKIGERRVLYLYAGLAIGLEVIIWLVPSLIGDGVAVGIVGMLLGPMYPITMNHTGRVLPRWLLTGSIGWIAGFGQAGSAVFPFMTGALASKFGIKTLQPLLVSMMAFMTLLWWLVPGAPRKAD
ncbi:major facilitator superfamily domain-containing protein [Rhodocollybia butyracea]|uniref:Major facilitator superfamily domain-containing protein n=1 Tax=Rhodocollybia butyracea TaxID=206335 RepID=A0A9P5QBN6_9AGAR|nr:major facilitator superfamily domain-containing protein [Rhodocollybia butyracea]